MRWYRWYNCWCSKLRFAKDNLIRWNILKIENHSEYYSQQQWKAKQLMHHLWWSGTCASHFQSCNVVGLLRLLTTSTSMEMSIQVTRLCISKLEVPVGVHILVSWPWLGYWYEYARYEPCIRVWTLIPTSHGTHQPVPKANRKWRVQCKMKCSHSKFDSNSTLKML